MEDDEDENSVTYKASKLVEMMDAQTSYVKFNERNVSEMLYTLSEAGIIEQAYIEDAEVLFKIFLLSNTITDEQIKSIRL